MIKLAPGEMIMIEREWIISVEKRLTAIQCDLSYVRKYISYQGKIKLALYSLIIGGIVTLIINYLKK